MEWEDWRLLTDRRLSVTSPQALNEEWSFIDGCNAHAVLDELDRAEAKAARRKR